MTDNLPGAVDRYLNSYTDIIKRFPPEGQKQTSRYYDVDWNHTHILNKLAFFGKQTKNFTFADGQRMKKMLIDALDLADRKVEISNHLMDMVDDNMFKLNMNIKDIQMTRVWQNKPNKKPKRMLKWVPNYKEIDSDSNDGVTENSNKYSNTNKTKITRTSNKNIQKKANLDSQLETSETVLTKTNQKIKKTTKDKNPRTQASKIKKIIISESSDSDTDVQPTYCVCEEISYGDMVCCDNDLCPIEWFHFGCVSLTKKPKGKWYCPRCRGTNSKLMKPRQVFFRELEEYNKRKEENWCIK